MDSDQFDIDVPDTIPEYITRRHQKRAKRTVNRAQRKRCRRWTRHHTRWAAVLGGIALISAVMTLWTVWPSPTTYVVIPTVLLVVGVGVATAVLVRKTGLDQL